MSGFCDQTGVDTNSARKNAAAIAREVLRWLFLIAHPTDSPVLMNSEPSPQPCWLELSLYSWAAEAWIIEGMGCGRVIDPEALGTLE